MILHHILPCLLVMIVHHITLLIGNDKYIILPCLLVMVVHHITLFIGNDSTSYYLVYW